MLNIRHNEQDSVGVPHNNAHSRWPHLHLAVDPGQHAGDATVDARLVFAAATRSPASHANQVPAPVLGLANQWPATVTLRERRE